MRMYLPESRASLQDKNLNLVNRTFSIRKPGVSYLLFLFFAIQCSTGLAQPGTGPDSMPVFDAHIHYSEDMWDALSAEEAIRRLRAIGVKRALVSSTGDEGTQRLYRADPEFVVPVLRPYRRLGTNDSWMYDESVIPYLRERLKQHRYFAIGEFHIEGNQAETPVVRAVVQLARQHGLMLHVHSDWRAVEKILAQDPDARIIWAHAGFEDNVIVRDLMDRHKNLWADLSFRYDILPVNTLLAPWQALLEDHADRFMLGIDTYEPGRWLKIAEVMQWQRRLLASLPDAVARKIAHENGERLTAGFR